MRTIHAVIPKQEIQALEVQGEFVLLNAMTGDSFGLDATGTELWKLLQDATTFDGWVQACLDRFEGIEESELRQELAMFTASLEQMKLVTVE